MAAIIGDITPCVLLFTLRKNIYLSSADERLTHTIVHTRYNKIVQIGKLNFLNNWKNKKIKVVYRGATHSIVIVIFMHKDIQSWGKYVMRPTTYQSWISLSVQNEKKTNKKPLIMEEASYDTLLDDDELAMFLSFFYFVERSMSLASFCTHKEHFKQKRIHKKRMKCGVKSPFLPQWGVYNKCSWLFPRHI